MYRFLLFLMSWSPNRWFVRELIAAAVHRDDWQWSYHFPRWKINAYFAHRLMGCWLPRKLRNEMHEHHRDCPCCWLPNTAA